MRINIDSTEVLLKLIDIRYTRWSDGRYRLMARSSGIFLMYDVTNRDSLKDVDAIISDFQRTFFEKSYFASSLLF